ncbi:MAG: hypothetical protein ACYTHJ_12425 [Planctomycetota bacterium]|jgi:hypothetical protein
MIKFFRKYNKTILIFMAILMFVFIGGAAFEEMITPDSNPRIAKTKYGDVTFKDRRLAESTTNILSSIGYFWQYPLGPSAAPINELDWVLLNREVDAMGLRQPIEAGQANLLATRTPDQLEQLSRRLRIRKDVMYEAVAEFLSIRELALSSIYTIPASAAEIRSAARDELDKVRINAVVLPARAFVDEQLTFTDEQLQAHFDEYKDKEPGQGMQFGYFVPASVKLQYIKINRDKIAEAMRIPNLEREARKYYEANKKTRFRRPQTDESVGGEFLTWEEAQANAIAEIRKEQADKQVNRIASWIIDKTTSAFGDVDRGEDMYRVSPPFVARPEYYDEIVEQLPKNLKFADAVTVGRTDFFTPEQSFDVPDLGAARAFDGQNSYVGRTGDLPFKTRKIVPQVPTDEGVRQDLYTSTFETSYYPFKNFTTGDKYVWRVLEVRDAHVPDSLDEVRDKVAADYKMKSAFDDAASYGRTLSYSALDGGMLYDAYEADEELQLIVEENPTAGIRYEEPEPFALARTASAGRDAGVFVGGIGPIPLKGAEQCFDLAESDEPFTVIEMPETSTVAVIGWVETIKGREDEFEEKRTSLKTSLVAARRREAAAGWFDRDNLRARTGYDTEDVN